MPTYGYQCTGCSDAFEVMQKITDNALTTCEKCGGELRKKVFPVGIVFKGSGFYVNDYAPKSAESDAPKTDAKPVEAKATEGASGDAAAPAASAPVSETKAPDAAKPAEPKAAAPAAPAAPSAAKE